jgi:hypothetical protein
MKTQYINMPENENFLFRVSKEQETENAQVIVDFTCTNNKIHHIHSAPQLSLQIEKKQQNHGKWSDPMMKYMDDYLTEIQQFHNQDMCQDMNVLFQFILHLKEEFINCNKQYTPPRGFSINFIRPVCCISSITISHLHEYISIQNQSSTN